MFTCELTYDFFFVGEHLPADIHKKKILNSELNIYLFFFFFGKVSCAVFAGGGGQGGEDS